MKRKAILTVAAMMVFALCTGLANAQVKTGEMAPDFTLTSAEGNTHSLSDFKGKHVVLEWINFDCPFVKKHYSNGDMPKLQSAAMQKEIVWLAINSSAEGKQGFFEGDALASRIAKEKFSANAYLIDTDGTVGKTYGAKTTPHMYVIDPDGTLRYQGAIDSIRSASPGDIAKADNYVMNAIGALMKDMDVDPDTTQPYGCSVKYAN